MVQGIAQRYAISQKFYTFKAKLLGKETLHYAERNLSYGELTHDISYEQAVAIIHKAFAHLDPQFVAIFEEFLQQ